MVRRGSIAAGGLGCATEHHSASVAQEAAEWRRGAALGYCCEPACRGGGLLYGSTAHALFAERGLQHRSATLLLLLNGCTRAAPCASKAAVAFNRGRVPMGVAFSWALLGLRAGSTASVRDLWQHKDQGAHQAVYRATVGAHDVVAIRLSPKKSTPAG